MKVTASVTTLGNKKNPESLNPAQEKKNGEWGANEDRGLPGPTLLAGALAPTAGFANLTHLSPAMPLIFLKTLPQS